MTTRGTPFTPAQRAMLANGRRKAAAEGRPGGPVPGHALSAWEQRRVEQSCVLTAAQVSEARRLAVRMCRLASPPRGWLTTLANRWGVGRSTLAAAVTGRTWAHLKRPAPVPLPQARRTRGR